MPNLDDRPQSAPIPHNQQLRRSSYLSTGSENHTTSTRHSHLLSRLSEAHTDFDYDVEDEDEDEDDRASVYDYTIRRSISIPHSAPMSRPVSVLRSPSYSIATPRPTLLFAIASDDVAQVRKVLESGDAGPNDLVGPQSALAFTLTNDQLKNKMDIVKVLLAFGADPSVLRNPELNPPRHRMGSDGEDMGVAQPCTPPPATMLDGMDPAMRYECSLYVPIVGII